MLFRSWWATALWREASQILSSLTSAPTRSTSRRGRFCPLSVTGSNPFCSSLNDASLALFGRFFKGNWAVARICSEPRARSHTGIFSVLFRCALCRLSALILFFSFVYFAQGLLSICLSIAALCGKLIMHAPLPWSFSRIGILAFCRELRSHCEKIHGSCLKEMILSPPYHQRFCKISAVVF